MDQAWYIQPGRFASVPDDEWGIEVQAPELLIKDPAVGAPVLSQVTQALTVGLSAKLVSREHAQEVFVKTLSEVGISLAVEDVREAIERESLEVDPQTQNVFRQFGQELERTA